ncbi:hypothetical protein E2C01_016744 [Portunus trituberculatus]|uniref:Uncharacterized protein n=1 Tax=Portunus trituberculatus TaxID=210409 RepID=A0A5B7DRK6_PORTR|nr:hypothetical protein [Portunus trituberculatus]
MESGERGEEAGSPSLLRRSPTLLFPARASLASLALPPGSRSSPGKCGSVTWNCHWNDLTPAGGQWLVLRRPLGPDWEEHTATTEAGPVFQISMSFFLR